MDLKYTGGDLSWSLPFGEHFYSASEVSVVESRKDDFKSLSNLEAIAHRYGFEPLYSVSKKPQQQQTTQISTTDPNLRWMNAGVLFTDKKIDSNLNGIHNTDFHDDHGHTFCYLCSINQHHHERTKPRAESQRRKLIPYVNPKALRVRSSSLDGIAQEPSIDLVPYRFVVRTGTRKNSGTRAQVFLYMYGTETNWTSINLRARSKQSHRDASLKAAIDGFPTGSIRTFCLKGPDIGQLHRLTVNLVGARSDKEWFLKEIEITNLATSVSWTCEFNCWLPKHDGHEYHEAEPRTKPKPGLSFDNLSVYVLQVRTGDKPFAGTDALIQVSVRGSKGNIRQVALTSSHSNLFEQNQLDTFTIVGEDIGDLLEMTVESDRSQFAADWDVKEVTMWKIMPGDEHDRFHVYFPFNTWLGKKASTLKIKGEKYPSIDHHSRGPTCYRVIVKTGSVFQAGTNANVFLIIYGKSGRTCIHQLDRKMKDDFERNSTCEFTLMDIDVGEIDRIKIWHDNSGVGPGWFLDSVIVRKKHSTCRTITNIFVQRLEQIAKVLYRRACNQLEQNYTVRTSSNEHENRSDRRRNKLKVPEDNESILSSGDRLGSGRGILRSPTMYDKTNAQKKVRWDEQSIGSQDESFPVDTHRMKSMQKHIEQNRMQDSKKRHESVSPVRSEELSRPHSGHFAHKAYWISTHNFVHDKWKIKSIEETDSFDFDASTRSLLLSDRLTITSKIKMPINENDDDVYEFRANRWLADNEGDRKVEVYLSPHSIQLSAPTRHEHRKPTAGPTKETPKRLTPETKHQPSLTSDLRREDSTLDSKKKHLAPPVSRSQPTLDSRHRTHDEKFEEPKRLSPHDLRPHQKHDDRSGRSPQDDRMDELKRSPPYDKPHQRHDDSIGDLKRSSPRDKRPPKFDDNLGDLKRSSPYEKPHQRHDDTIGDLKRSSPLDKRPPKFDDNLGELKRSSPLDLSRLDRSPRDLGPLDRSPRDLRPPSSSSSRPVQPPYGSDQSINKSKALHRDINLDDPRSFQRTVEPSPRQPTTTLSAPFKRQEEPLSSLTRSTGTSLLDNKRPPISSLGQHSKSPRGSNDLAAPLASDRELIARMSAEPPLYPKPAASSMLDARYSTTTSTFSATSQRSKSSRITNDPVAPLASDRELLSRMSREPPIRPKSAVRSNVELTSHRAPHDQVYRSAYGTLPSDDF